MYCHPVRKCQVNWPTGSLKLNIDLCELSEVSCGPAFFFSFSHNYNFTVIYFTCIVCVRPIVKGVVCPVPVEV